MILTDANALLFIEPKDAPRRDLTVARTYDWFGKLVNQQIASGQTGCYDRNTFAVGDTYLHGCYTCSCGAQSANYDILLPNHMATNSLAFHYIVQHTKEVPEEEWRKLDEVRRFHEFTIIELKGQNDLDMFGL